MVLHLTGIVMWVGGLLAATLVMAQAARETPGATGSDGERQAAREAYRRISQRLLRALAHPGLILTIAGGLGLIFQAPRDVLQSIWLQAKLALVVGLVCVDWMITRQVRQMENAVPARGAALRMHALTATIFVIVLILVLVQP